MCIYHLSSELQWYRSDWLDGQSDLLFGFLALILPSGLILGCFIVQIKRSNREHNGSVVECSTRDRGAAGLSLTGITVLCP